MFKLCFKILKTKKPSYPRITKTQYFSQILWIVFPFFFFIYIFEIYSNFVVGILMNAFTAFTLITILYNVWMFKYILVFNYVNYFINKHIPNNNLNLCILRIFYKRNFYSTIKCLIKIKFWFINNSIKNIKIWCFI